MDSVEFGWRSWVEFGLNFGAWTSFSPHVLSFWENNLLSCFSLVLLQIGHHHTDSSKSSWKVNCSLGVFGMLRCLTSPRVWMWLWQVCSAPLVSTVVRPALKGLGAVLTWSLEEHTELCFEIKVCWFPFSPVAGLCLPQARQPLPLTSPCSALGQPWGLG